MGGDGEGNLIAAQNLTINYFQDSEDEETLRNSYLGDALRKKFDGQNERLQLDADYTALMTHTICFQLSGGKLRL